MITDGQFSVVTATPPYELLPNVALVEQTERMIQNSGVEMAVQPLGSRWRKNLMDPMSFHFVKRAHQSDELFLK